MLFRSGRSLISGADATAQRTTLGLGTMATQASTSYVAKAGDTMTNQLVLPAGSTTAPSFGIAGDTNCGMAQLGGTDTLGVVTAGVERWRVGSNGAVSSVIPGGSALLPQFQCRAWVNFDGRATVSIRGSGNVSSITRPSSAGEYTISFLTAMPDATYAVVASSHRTTTLAHSGDQVYTFLTGSVTVAHFENVANTDCDIVTVAIFR